MLGMCLSFRIIVSPGIFQKISVIACAGAALVNVKSEKMPCRFVVLVRQSVYLRHQNCTAEYIIKGNSPVNLRIFLRSSDICIRLRRPVQFFNHIFHPPGSCCILLENAEYILPVYNLCRG